MPDELGTHQTVGILRVGSVQPAPVSLDGSEALLLLPAPQALIGLGNLGRAVTYDSTGDLHG